MFGYTAVPEDGRTYLLFILCCCIFKMALWRSGNGVGRINEVTLR